MSGLMVHHFYPADLVEASVMADRLAAAYGPGWRVYATIHRPWTGEPVTDLYRFHFDPNYKAAVCLIVDCLIRLCRFALAGDEL